MPASSHSSVFAPRCSASARIIAATANICFLKFFVLTYRSTSASASSFLIITSLLTDEHHRTSKDSNLWSVRFQSSTFKPQKAGMFNRGANFGTALGRRGS